MVVFSAAWDLTLDSDDGFEASQTYLHLYGILMSNPAMGLLHASIALPRSSVRTFCHLPTWLPQCNCTRRRLSAPRGATTAAAASSASTPASATADWGPTGNRW